MKVSVYLHSYVVDTLRMYGKLDDVINAMLDEADNGMFDVTDKPNCESRDGASRYMIDVTNENYLLLMQSYPPNSSKISLRRLIYWFVENEIYEECGWTTNNVLKRKENNKIHKKVIDIKEQSAKLLSIVSDNYEAMMILTDMLRQIGKLENLYKE